MVYKRNMFQKAVSLLLTVSLLVSGVGTTARAEAPVEPVEKSQLRVVGTLTDGGKYLELGLSIDGKAASFQSAGVLLKYDTTKLTPLKWGAVEDESGVLADAKINVPAATATNAAWKEASILPTKSKGADDLVGKTAKAVKLSESATSAYLYLSAEAPKGQLLNQLLPEEKGTAPTGLPPATANGKTITAIGVAEAPANQVVTVRFLVGTTKDAEPDAVERNYTLAELVAAIDLVVYNSATPNADELKLLQRSPLAVPGGTPTKLEGLSYIADNADYTTAGFTTAADVSFVWVAAGQTVDSGGGGGPSIQLSLAGGTVPTPQETAYKVFQDTCKAAITGVKVPIADITPVRVGYLFAGWSDGSNIYAFREDDPATPDIVEEPDKVTLGDTPIVLTAVWTSVPDGFAAITMFDWDNTLLGAVVVTKNSDATQVVKDFVASLSATAEQLNGTLYFEDSLLPLTYKRGYSFDMEAYGVWLDYTSETLTHYGSEVQGVMVEKPPAYATAQEHMADAVAAAEKDALAAAAGVIDLSNVTGNIQMKTSYGANSELYIGGGATERYTTELLSVERVAGDVFIVTVLVRRENIHNGSAVGVARLGKPAVRVNMKSGIVTVPSLVTMKNNDEVIIQTVPSKLVDSYSYSVVETYQNDNWPNAGIKSAENGDERGEIENNLIENNVWTGTGYTANGFLFTGTMSYINKALYPGGDVGQVVQGIMTDMQLNYNMVKASPNTPANKVKKAQQLIKAAFDELNGLSISTPTKPIYQHLTYKQIQYAIANDGTLLTENID